MFGILSAVKLEIGREIEPGRLAVNRKTVCPDSFPEIDGEFKGIFGRNFRPVRMDEIRVVVIKQRVDGIIGVPRAVIGFD